MCGIVGIAGHNLDEIQVDTMLQSIVHRGPDDFKTISLEKCKLGFARLAIVDLDKGQQPYFNENRDIVCIFNGEIYNHNEWRKFLSSRNHKFSTHHADGEIIVHLYEEYGEDFVAKLEGMFSIAIWDLRLKKLLLARDHFGIKPLFYSFANGKLHFGSEIKAIRKMQANTEPNTRQINNFILDGTSKAPETMYSNIHQVLPGELLEFSTLSNKIKFKKYYNPGDNFNKQEVSKLSEIEISSEILRILERNVKRQTMSDVGFGALLSGGIDSSAVAVLASKFSNKQIDTFCAFYPDVDAKGKIDDLLFSREISSIIGSSHHEIPITSTDVANNFSKLIQIFDEPFGGVTTNYFVSQEISKHTKVALTGDGSDEIFGSYQMHRVASIIMKMSDGTLISKDDLIYSGLSTKQLKIIAKYKDNRDKYESAKIQIRSKNLKLYFKLTKDEPKDTIELNYPDLDLLNFFLVSDVKDLLSNQVLPFVDRLSMHNSVELRPPFLNTELVDFAFSIPGKIKIKDNESKHILKLALTNLLPKNLLHRKKEGFVLPLTQWLNGDLRKWSFEKLQENRYEYNPFLNSHEIDKLYNLANFDFKTANILWRAIILCEWWHLNYD